MSLSEVVEAWDAVGAACERERIHPLGADAAAYEASGEAAASALLDAFGDLPDGPIIDFGCGDGRVAIPFARLVAPRKVLAVDSSASMIGQLEAHRGGVEVQTALADGTFPIVGRAAGIYSLAVLIHHRHDDAARIIANLAYSLPTGGKLVLDLPLYENRREPRDWIDVAAWTLPELEALAAYCSLSITSATVRPGEFSYSDHDWVTLLKR